MAIKKKVVFLPYDFDTAIGTNNEGALQFSYNLEDIDVIGNNEDVYNGQQSVLWNNVRDAFKDELKAMYQTLRSQGALSYEKTEEMFEQHQNKWPESVINEDEYFTYLEPLINPQVNADKKPDSGYLSMLQGTKEQQRKWWLYNRYRYIDSKYNAGDALTDVITLRAYAKANITVTPYADIYASIKYGSYLRQERATRNQSYTIVCPVDNMNDTEVYIYSASQLASIGDLSPLMVGYANFSNATRLQSLKVGDASSNYQNTVMLDLFLGNNVLLETLDARNCVNLGGSRSVGGNIVNSTTPTIDLRGCVDIKNIYFDGTSIKGVNIPNGAPLRVLHLPATITNLTLRNLDELEDLTCPSFANVTTLRIENCSNVVNPLAILDDIPANSRVRIIGFDINVNSYQDIVDFYDELDTMRGLDENGNTVEIANGGAQVSGTIHINSLTGAQLAELQARYPYITIDAAHTTSYRYFKSYDGSSNIGTVECQDGIAQSAAPTVPARTDSGDGHYSYTPLGWSTNTDSQTANYNHNNETLADVTYYAAYTWNTKTYTVTWNNSNNITLQTDNNVPWGTTPVYNGFTPVDPSGNNSPFVSWSPIVGPITGSTVYTANYKSVWTVKFYNQTGATVLETKNVVDGNSVTYTGTTPTNSEGGTFLGWATKTNSSNADAVLTNITGNKNFYAAHASLVENVKITDSWDTIITNIDNGTYKTKYKLGNYKPIDLGTTYGTINMQIVAIDEEAPLSFLAKELLLQTHSMNSTNTNANGWPNTGMRSWLSSTILPLIPSNIRDRIQKVTKTSYDYTTKTTITSVDKLFIPSAREIFGGTSYENSGVVYTTIYKDATSRIKTKGGTTSWWWLRSANSDYSSSFRSVSSNGSVNNVGADYASGVCVGFCLGLEPETIDDSWDTILSKSNPSESYSIGDTKKLSINGEDHLMQIVAFDEDNSKISWLMKDLLTATHRMNATSTNANGWPNTEMRSWLRNTILPTIDSNVRNHIAEVNKTYYDYTDKTTETIADTIWLASAREIFGGTSYENSGVDYTTLFKDNTSRIKKREGTANWWWLRSASSDSSYVFRGVNSNGSVDIGNAGSASGVCVGFCTN